MIDIKAAPFNLDDEGVKWVEETKQNMTLEEKIGQLMIPIGYSADPGYLQHVMLDHQLRQSPSVFQKRFHPLQFHHRQLATDGFRNTAKSRC